MQKIQPLLSWWFGLSIILGFPFAISGAESPTSGTNFIALPFQVQRGHVMLSATVSGTNSLRLLLDTGYGMTMLNSSWVERLGLKRTGQITIVGIAGEEPAGVFEGPSFEFSGAIWKPRRVAAFPADNRSRSRRRDGILGSAFFRRFVVEIDPQTNQLRLHDPNHYEYQGNGEVLAIRFRSTTPIVSATVRLHDNSEVETSFEVDTGCDGALCIGKHFVEKHRLLASTNNGRSGRQGVGGAAKVQSGHLAAIQLGRLTIQKPAAEFFLEGSPVDEPLAGHIGWSLLNDFKVIFDYKRSRLILERAKNDADGRIP